MNLLDLILTGLSEEQVEALNRAEREGTILNHPDIFSVVDADGDPLIKDQVYQLQRLKPTLFRPTKYQFGSGNFMDTYYWVWGIDGDLKDDRITVEVKHRRGKPPIYSAPLKKTFTLESLPEDIRLEILRRRLVEVKNNAQL